MHGLTDPVSRRRATRGVTGVVMSGSAIVLGAMGVVALVLPVVVGGFLGLPRGGEVVVQMMAAGLLAMATLNWIGRGAIYGGIFGRPIVVANLMFGTVSSLSLVSALVRGELEASGWILAMVMGAHALAFAYLMRSPPYPTVTATVPAD